MRSYFLLIFVAFACVHSAQDCNFVLRGHVHDEDNHEHLGFAVIKELSSGRVFEANEHGEFVIDKLCAGDVHLLIRHVGCDDSVFVIPVQRSRSADFRLPHSMNALRDVEVVTMHVAATPVQAVTTLEGRSLERARGEDLTTYLKQAPGVVAYQTGASVSKPVLHGMQGYRLLMVNNGVRHEAQQWGSEHAPEIDPYVAGRMVVLKGASSVRYGSDAIAGTILVDPFAMPDSVGFSGEANTSLQSNGRGGAASLMIQQRLRKLPHLSWRAQASTRKLGDRQAPDYVLRNTGQRELNYSAAVDYHTKEWGASFFYSEFGGQTGIFSGAHASTLADLNAAINRRKPIDSLAEFSYEIGRPYQNILHRMSKALFDFHTGPRARVNIMYAVQYNRRSEFDKDVPRSAALRALNLADAAYEITTHSGEVVWEHDVVLSFRGSFGVQGQLQDNSWSGRFFIPFFTAISGGVFAVERFVRPHYELEAGFRYDYKEVRSSFYVGKTLINPVRNFSNVSYNVGAAYRPFSWMRATVNLASGWRAPAPNELYSSGLHHGAGAIERGNADLTIEKCNNAIAGIMFDKGPVKVDFSGYYYHFDNFIYFAPSQTPELTIRGAFPVLTFTQNAAAIAGSDANVEFRLLKTLAVAGRGMMLKGTNLDNGQPLIYMPPARFTFSLRWAPKLRGRFSDLIIEPEYTFVSRQSRFPQAMDLLPPPAAYALFGLNASVTARVYKQPIVFAFVITNGLNAVYRDYLDRFRYFADAPGVNYALKIRIPINQT